MKDSQYWKDYNQKRKGYLAQKKRESRAKVKEVVVDQLAVVDLLGVVDKVVDMSPVVDSQLNNQVVDLPQVVDQAPISTTKAKEKVVDQRRVVNPTLPQLIHHYQTGTNYNCASGCRENKYCSNCWYFAEDKLIDYKGDQHG